ncbi:GNAT family N-acetyltransferase [Vibrio coralliilyticus]|uniref:GNAT family N-acetyltransferase n=1 Tax=Vibrio coralliilyticus TaxID=190893 RepID=UPI00068C8BDE|nr:GNAT family protein [Vibrio coralliilyticus]NOH38221.1 GNAT family N-acetyltransferase [Vibrio coralliilyticus]NOH55066.1 GNAT family N-acetyltransferase [Vibrio coralliilyticus]NOI30406.1 GNAT family N-acetyltransferase [Vibrio coralliilyticus]NOI49994.1 GNAT family N-acetyltransferase [Vibrio coralliilyticus]NOI60754.1 GNAT family N-acetyltransferase [Vibrio coralliilyticus]
MHTDRLIIRSWLPSDRAPFAQLNQHPNMVGCCADQQSRDASDRFAAQCESLIEARGWGLWALELRATHAFVGFAGLQLELSPLGEEQVLLDARLSPTYWGAGLAQEAATFALRYAFGSLALNAVYALAPAPQSRSCLFLSRLGFEGDSRLPQTAKGQWILKASSWYSRSSAGENGQ